MIGSEFTCFSLWWIIPVIMMVLCFFIVMGRRGPMRCGFGFGETNNRQTKNVDTSLEILNKRFASGDINNDEYQEMKKALIASTDSIHSKSKNKV